MWRGREDRSRRRSCTIADWLSQKTKLGGRVVPMMKVAICRSVGRWRVSSTSAQSSDSNMLRVVLCRMLDHAYMQALDAKMQPPEHDFQNPVAVWCVSCDT